MPIYEYRCSSCGHELEALQKFSDQPLTSCPACNAMTLVKLVSAAGFHLKGSGWYATDFKGGSKPAPARASGDAKPDAKPEATSETKGEAKAAKAASDTGSKSDAASSSTAPASATGATPASS